MCVDLVLPAKPLKFSKSCLISIVILTLQETHFSCKRQAEKFEKFLKGKCFWSFGTGKSAGVAVIFAPNFSGNVFRFLFDPNEKILSLLVDFHNLYFNVVNIYSPNAASERKILFLICTLLFSFTRPFAYRW